MLATGSAVCRGRRRVVRAVRALAPGRRGPGSAEQRLGGAVGPHQRLEVELAGVVTIDAGSLSSPVSSAVTQFEQLAHLPVRRDERLAHVVGERERRDHVVHRRVHHRVDHREQPEREQLGGAGDPARRRRPARRSGRGSARSAVSSVGLLSMLASTRQRRPAPDVLERRAARAPGRSSGRRRAARRRPSSRSAAAGSSARRRVRSAARSPSSSIVGVVERRDHLQEREPVGGDPARADHRRPAEEVALEQVAAGGDADLVLGARAELVGQHQARVRAQARRRARASAGGRARAC